MNRSRIDQFLGYLDYATNSFAIGFGLSLGIWIASTVLHFSIVISVTP